MTESLRPRHPPFRSLDFFTSADAAIFAGREEEIEEVATRILAGNTLVVYGPSGVGKTSLLCAGVARMTEPAHRAYCLQLALSDDNPVVATVASKTLSVVAGTEEAAKIALALKDRSTRPRALWVLADLTEKSTFHLQAPARALGIARRERERRQLLPAWETVQGSAWDGLRIGAGTGALSGLGGIVFWCIAAMWLGHDDVATYAGGAAVIAVVSMMLSMVCGYAAGQAMAKLQALDRNPTWTLAIRDRGTLGALAVTPILGALGIAFFFVVAAKPLGFTQIGINPYTTFAATALGTLAPAAVLFLVELTAWTLPRILWHRTRSPVIVAIRTFSLSWLLTISIWTLLVYLVDEPPATMNVIMAMTTLFATWCSICATSIATMAMALKQVA